VVKAAWPRDEGALYLLKAAVFASHISGLFQVRAIGTFASLAPGSAGLKLFDASVKLDLAGVNTIKVPCVAALPPQPVFVEEGKPAPAESSRSPARQSGPYASCWC
jgi:hypothetical protein